MRGWRRVRIITQILALMLVLFSLLVVVTLAVEQVRARPLASASVLAAIITALLALAALAGRLGRRVPSPAVLELDLTQPLSDVAPGDALGRVLSRGRLTLRAAVEALEQAGRDPHVAGLVARIGAPAGGLADLQELRDGVLAFREGGSFALAQADTFGGSGSYYLASAFDEVLLQPSGDVNVMGVAAQVTFLRGALDRLEVESQLVQRHEYKAAANRFTETGFTPAHREATESLVSSLFDQIVTGIARGRGLEEGKVRALVDRAPLSGAEALEAGLVDRLAYADEAIDHAKQRVGEGASLLPLASYHRRTYRVPRRAARVALIHGSGQVQRGRRGFSPLTRRAMAAETTSAAFREAVDDRRVKAILFRVDSPGGSYVASDTIWREAVRAREAGKPVVVSMGNVAASGGYFVAVAADRIVAHPATLTGSIGTFGGKVVLARLARKLGLNNDEVHAGQNALFASSLYRYTPRQWSHLQHLLDRVYDDFITKVLQGRSLPAERADAIARGRVWTGQQAADLGLVDVLGGYPAALRAVREVAGLAPDAVLRLVPFPRRRRRPSVGGEAADAGDAVLLMADLPILRW